MSKLEDYKLYFIDYNTSRYLKQKRKLVKRVLLVGS